MGAAARAAAAEYNPARVTDRLLIVYEELLAHHIPATRGGPTCV